MYERHQPLPGSVFVIAEIRGHHIHSVTFELLGKARELADGRHGAVTALVLFERLEEPLENLLSSGADRILAVRHPALRQFDQAVYTKVLAELIERERPEIVLAGATSSGRTYMPALAAKVRTGLTADCTGLEIDADSDLLLQTRPAIGGNVMATIKTPDHVPQMATVRPRTFRPPSPTPRNGKIMFPQLPRQVFESPVQNIGFERTDGEEINIQDLEVVLSGGRGLKRPANFRLLEDLAHLLQGGVGASRPVVESKWIGYPHQVGLSGKVVSPRFYLAAGISGAVQHLAGMQTAETIVAVNKDPEAPIFRVADIALCGDLTDILPRLIDKIRRTKEAPCHD